MTDEPLVRLRRKRGARLVQQASGITAYPEPHTSPVLPAGWAPLDLADESAVLEACDAAPDACRLRLGSIWDAAIEYRVYCLEGDEWGGVCAATVFTFEKGRGGLSVPPHNTRLLGIAHAPADAARVAVDFLNWDLEADGSSWRLSLTGEGTEG